MLPIRVRRIFLDVLEGHSGEVRYMRRLGVPMPFLTVTCRVIEKSNLGYRDRNEVARVVLFKWRLLVAKQLENKVFLALTKNICITRENRCST